MKNKIVVIVFFGLISVSILSFADDKQVITPKESAGELDHDKATFNMNQAVYNDKTNKDIRVKQSVEKKIENNKQYNEKVQTEQDVNKGQFVVKF